MTSTLETVKENKFGKMLGWCGGIASILGLIAAVYFGVIKRDEPNLEYDVISATRFFNNSESAAYIKVFINDSIDVQENHLNITAYNIKVENKGSNHIRYNDYNQGFFGLKIDNGTLLDVPHLLSASNDDIEKNFYSDTIAKCNSKIEIPKLSLDIDDNYVIKIVVLHNADSIPKFYPEGKISGQKSIVINETPLSNLTFWSVTLGGNWLVQVVRFLSYFLAGFLLLLGIDFVMNKIDDKKRKQEREIYEKQKEAYEKQKKQKEIDEKKSREAEINKLNAKIIPSIKDEYINEGWYGTLSDLHHIFLIYKESEITERYRKMPQFILHGKNSNIDEEEFDSVKKEYEKYNYYISKNYFIYNNNAITITFNQDAKDSVNALFDFHYEKIQQENPYKSLDDILNTSN